MKRLLIIITAVFICLCQMQVLAGETASNEAGRQDTYQKEYDTPEMIQKVQEALNAAGYDCGTPDGIAGSKTKDAIVRYKTDHGMDETTADINYNFLVEIGILEDPVPLTEGDVYEKAMELDSELKLSATSDSLTLEREFENSSEENIKLFFYDVCKMIGIVADDGTYASMLCTYWADKNVLILNVSGIENRVNFRTFTPGAIAQDKDTNTYWVAYYLLTFSAHDQSAVLEKQMEDLKKDNGMEYKVPDNYRNGYYWALTSFGPSVAPDLSDEALTVSMKAVDTLEDGWNVGKITKDAISFFNEIYTTDPDSMPYGKFSISYTDQNTDKTLYSLIAEQVDGGWKTTEHKVYGDLFTRGALGYQEGKTVADLEREEETAKQTEETTEKAEETVPISEKEILFRGIPWGTKGVEVDKTLGAEGDDLLGNRWGSLGDPNTMYNLRSSGVLDYTSGIEDLLINGAGERGWFRKVDLAGYTPSDVYTFYLYPVENGKLIRSKEDAGFYFGYYIFRPGEFSDYAAIYDDLKEKLGSIYGEGSEKDAYLGVATTWVDKDGNMVALSYSPDYDVIELGYIMGGADDRLLEAKAILDAEALDEENQKREENANNNTGL